MTLRGAVTVVLLAAIAACGPPADDFAERELECQKVCDRTGQCPGLRGGQECLDACLASHFPAGCGDAVKDASCTELSAGAQGSGAWVNACYPKCSPDKVACSGDTLMACSLGRLLQQDCEWVCKDRGDTYSGVCAKTKDGQTSPNGLPQCWCE